SFYMILHLRKLRNLAIIIYHTPTIGIKSLLDAVGITAAQVYVNLAQLKLVLLVNFKENILSSYYCWNKDMDQDSAHMVAASKVPLLKPENGATLPKTTMVEGVETVMPITTAEEKT
ncbi:hypothetical protein Tco_0531422, partial [Tanacetum coccineum]